MQLQPSPGRPRVALLATALAGLLVLAPSGAHADTPTPVPVLTPAASPGPSGSPTGSATPGSGSPTPAPSTSSPSTPSPSTPSPSTPAPSSSPSRSRPSSSPSGPARAAPARPAAGHDATRSVAVSLQVSPSGSPVAGRFFQDVGRYAFTGTATALPAGSSIAVYRRPASRTTWTRVSSASVVDGSFASALPVTARGPFVFVATTGGAPGSGDEVRSGEVRVQVADSTASLDQPAATVDSLKNPMLAGSVVPARKGVEVHLDVKVGSRFRLHTTARTDAAGRYRARFSHGKGTLARYTVRATTKAPNRNRWEISGNRTVRRVAVLNAVVHETTAAEVARTYRKGCPVGRSKLSTITMNYYGRDKAMHRGVLVIRTDLVPEIRRSFGKGLSARFPIAKMNNPNVYGGDDTKQMAANNTSGFNCRKVVGNPYAQSPHSYGIAIDVDTVQNPYRDSRGTWWPANGKPYIDRTPLRFGMLGAKSALTRQLRSDGFFWGGLWSPGRDYQHFEYRR